MKQEATSQPLIPPTRNSRKLSLVWVVPIVAVLLGGWLVFRHIQSRGPLITVHFKTAEGIEAGKTELRSRSVRVGLVESVSLADDLKGVVVQIRIDPGSEDLVRADSRFWVVRARVSGANIIGLGTIMSGAYVELEPGTAANEGHDFAGLEEPPVTPNGVPGLRLDLFASDSVQARVGSPVYFEGNQVGKIERRRFNPETKDVELRAFISERYEELVTDGVVFWSDSGVEVTVGADGFKLDLPSLEALVVGGITFGTIEGLDVGEPVNDEFQFMLFASEAKAREKVFVSGGDFLLLFDQSVRGLSIGAKVEFRGLPVGRVADIAFEVEGGDMSRRIPVRIELNKSLADKNLPRSLRGSDPERIALAVSEGLRGSLRPSNLLTGQLFVDLDFYKDAEPVVVEEAGGFTVLPTTESGLGRLEEQVAALLAKLEQLPLAESMAKLDEAVEQGARTLAAAETAFNSSEGALAEARDALNAVRGLLESPEVARLPEELRETLVALRGSLQGVGPESSVYGDLRRTMDELRGAARSIERVATTIEEKPNSLVFGKGLKRETIPRAIPTR